MVVVFGIFLVSPHQEKEKSNLHLCLVPSERMALLKVQTEALFLNRRLSFLSALDQMSHPQPMGGIPVAEKVS